MREYLKNRLLFSLGCLSVLLGLIGVVLPLLPTTPFMILALALFSKSSPRFHQMLLHSAWFGPVLQQWESTRTLSRRIKYRASALIILTFGISVWVLSGRLPLQLMLVGLCSVLLFFIWRIKEK